MPYVTADMWKTKRRFVSNKLRNIYMQIFTSKHKILSTAITDHRSHVSF